jgi:antitoxin YefM
MSTVTLSTPANDPFFLQVYRYLNQGKKVILSAPRKSLVVMSEAEYQELDKARRNQEYLDKIDQGMRDVEAGRGIVVSLEKLEEMAR